MSSNRRRRVEAIASFLAESDYDIVALQELWVFSDYEHVREMVSKSLPYSKFFYRCVVLMLAMAETDRWKIAVLWEPALSYSRASLYLRRPFIRTHSMALPLMCSLEIGSSVKQLPACSSPIPSLGRSRCLIPM